MSKLFRAKKSVAKTTSKAIPKRRHGKPSKGLTTGDDNYNC